jgi:hypothetical protein
VLGDVVLIMLDDIVLLYYYFDIKFKSTSKSIIEFGRSVSKSHPMIC